MTDQNGTAQVDPGARPKNRSRLFLKYAGLFVAVVSVALLVNGLFEIWGSYRTHKATLIQIQHEQAEAAATKIGQFVNEIQSQLGWTTQLLWSTETIEQRRFDALRLLRQVPAITELSQVDASGKEQLRVSRLAMDVVGSGLDLSKEPKFTEAVKNKIYYGPVYFRRESEPYMTLSLAGTRRDAGVSIAEVNLKLIWDVVSKIKVGQNGHAYVVDGRGRLIAHPDISLVLRNTDMSRLAQVQAAQHGQSGNAEDFQAATDIQGRQVLTPCAGHSASAGQYLWSYRSTKRISRLLPIKRTALVLFGALLQHLPNVPGSSDGIPIQALASAPGSAAATWHSVFQSRLAMSLRHSPINLTIWRAPEESYKPGNKVELRTRELAQRSASCAPAR